MATKKTGTAKKPETSLLAKKLASQAKIMKSMAKDGGAGGRIPGQSPENVDFRPTGLPVFDEEVLGIGGLPKGKIIEMYGKESSGKTAVFLYTAGMIQREDPSAVVKIYDAERAWTDPWGLAMGLDLNRVILPTFRGADAMAEQIQADLASEYPPDIIGIDSLAVIQPSQILGKRVEDLNMNDNMARASFYTSFFNKIVDGYYWPPLKKKEKLGANNKFYDLKSSRTSLVCINHAKQKTESSNGQSWTVWYTVGGVSLDFHASIRLMCRRGKIEAKDKLQFQIVHLKADKNKLAPPQRECDIKLSYKGGMEQVGSVNYLEMAEQKALVAVEGSWIKATFLPGGQMQGRDNFNAFVNTDPDVKKLIAG